MFFRGFSFLVRVGFGVFGVIDPKKRKPDMREVKRKDSRVIVALLLLTCISVLTFFLKFINVFSGICPLTGSTN